MEEIFSIRQSGERPYEFYDNVHVGIVYEMNLDRMRIQRNVFSLLDWLGDVGGLFEIIFVFSSILVSIYNFQTFEIYMVRKLFKKKANIGKSTNETEPALEILGPISKVRLAIQEAMKVICRKYCCNCGSQKIAS